MAERRDSSVPVGGSPFWSSRAQEELMLQMARPRDLPEMQPVPGNDEEVRDWWVGLLAEDRLLEHRRAGQIEGQSQEIDRLQVRCQWRWEEADWMGIEEPQP